MTCGRGPGPRALMRLSSMSSIAWSRRSTAAIWAKRSTSRIITPWMRTAASWRTPSGISTVSVTVLPNTVASLVSFIGTIRPPSGSGGDEGQAEEHARDHAGALDPDREDVAGGDRGGPAGEGGVFALVGACQRRLGRGADRVGEGRRVVAVAVLPQVDDDRAGRGRGVGREQRDAGDARGERDLDEALE